MRESADRTTVHWEGYSSTSWSPILSKGVKRPEEPNTITKVPVMLMETMENLLYGRLGVGQGGNGKSGLR